MILKRRDFVKQAAGAGGMALTHAVLSTPATAATGKSGRVLRAGLIGCGWYGMVDLRHVMESGRAQVTRICDPDQHNLEKSAAEIGKRQGQRPDTFSDHRLMLKDKDLDIVLVGSPDHWHALHAIDAMKAGADLYLQKPISHTLGEGIAMVNCARALKRVVQVGTQRRSTPHILDARDFIRSGKIGHVGAVRTYCYVPMRGNDHPPDEKAPAHIDWDMWTGPAPLRPYNPGIHPRRWRLYEEYSNGILGDMGVHMLDLMRWILDKGHPTRVSSMGGVYVQKAANANVPDTQQALFQYEDMTASWEHCTYGAAARSEYPWAVSFHGEKGTVNISLDNWTYEPQDPKATRRRYLAARDKDHSGEEQDHIRPAGRAHMLNFLDAVANRRRPVADIEEGHISTALCQLGNLSRKLGRDIRWDGKTQTVVADEEANRMLTRAYRKPWVYPV